MKKINVKIIFLLAVLAAVIALTALAASADDGLTLIDGDDTAPAQVQDVTTIGQSYSPNQPDLDRVRDFAGLMTDDQNAELRKMIADYTAKHGVDLVIVTTRGTEGKEIEAYCDDFYDYSGYGCGTANNGAIICYDIQNDIRYIGTTGSAIEIFTDYGIQQLGGEVRGRLDAGDNYGGFVRFVELADEYTVAYENGRPVDDYSGSTRTRQFSIVPYLIVLGVGIIVALIVTGSMKAKMKTAVKQTRAAQYFKRDSLDIMKSEDKFLYSHVAATPRASETTRSGGSGGGSSTHVSSSGTTHGGGRF